MNQTQRIQHIPKFRELSISLNTKKSRPRYTVVKQNQKDKKTGQSELTNNFPNNDSLTKSKFLNSNNKQLEEREITNSLELYSQRNNHSEIDCGPGFRQDGVNTFDSVCLTECNHKPWAECPEQLSEESEMLMTDNRKTVEGGQDFKK